MSSQPVSANPSPPSLVVFDLAGTTVEDKAKVAEFLQGAMAFIGYPVSFPEANAVMGERKPVAIAKLLTPRLGPTTLEHPLVEKGNTEFLRLTNHYYATSPEVREIEGASAVFSILRRAGLRIACDTGFERSTVDILLGRLGWLERGLLDAHVTSDEVPHGRPAPDLIFEAMRRTGITDIKRVAKVGDTPSDIGEGHAAGCPWVIAVTYGTHRQDQLEPHHPTHFLHELNALPALLGVAL